MNEWNQEAHKTWYDIRLITISSQLKRKQLPPEDGRKQKKVFWTTAIYCTRSPLNYATINKTNVKKSCTWVRTKTKGQVLVPKKETFSFLSITLTTKNITFMFLFLFEVVVVVAILYLADIFLCSFLSLKCEKKGRKCLFNCQKVKIKKVFMWT